MKHGTAWSYEKGCRCETCTYEESTRNKKYRRKRTPEKRLEDLERLDKLREKDPEKNGGKIYAKKRWLKNKYGMNLEQYESFLTRHDRCCDACQSTEGLCIDHNHETGRVRGLLCGRCNKALGLVKENPETLKVLVDYIIADTLVEFS